MMTAGQLMRTGVFTFSPHLPIAAAVDALLEKGLSAAPVVDVEHRVVGMLSERDCLLVLSAAAYHVKPTGTVADYMARDVLAIPPTIDLFRLAFLFHENPLRSLPVVDADGRLKGLITRRDVVHGLDRVRGGRKASPALPVTYVPLEERRAGSG